MIRNRAYEREWGRAASGRGVGFGVPTVRRLPLRLLCSLLPLLAASCGGDGDRVEPPTPRLLLIGWDGATFDLLDPLLEEGRLPNVAELLERGRSAHLESSRIPISSAAWSSAMTGVGPGEHGVYGFFERVADSYEVQLVDSTRLAAPPLWRILTRRGLRCHVFGVPLTWPPEATHGVTVAGMLAPPDGEFASPPGLASALRDRGFIPDLGVWRESAPADRDRVLRQLALKRDVLVELLEQPDWDCSVVVFKSLDVISHRVYDGLTDTFVAELLTRLDTILGQLLDAAGPDTRVVLMSDHGFANYSQAFNLHAWLIEQGYAVRGSGAATSPVVAGPLAEQRPAQHLARLQGLDLASSRALSSVCEGNFGSLSLNLVDREPSGSVSAEEFDELLEQLEADLRSVTFGEQPVVEEVWRGASLYPGPHAARAVPDLVFRTRQDMRVYVEDTARPSLHESYPGPFPDHTLDGIWICAGPGIAPLATRERHSIDGVAPTALALLEQPAHTEMTGRFLLDALAGNPLIPRVPRASDGNLQRDPASTPTRDSAQMQALLEALASMGYANGVEDEED